jgi:peptide/nickel transport system substrate-binding protein
MKTLRFAAAAALLALGCETAAAQSHLRIGLAEDPDVLDPTLARTYVGRIVFASICDKLFDVNEKLEVVPQLALSHETSEDGKSVTIKLRPGVKFHDGEALDAEAAKFSLERHMTMQGSFRKPDLGPVDKVEVVDPLTVRLVLKAPSSPLIAQLTDRAGMMVSPKAAKEAGDKFGLKPVCAGPYKFVERVQQDRIVVEKFADYWNKQNVHIDRITYLPIVDGTVRLANLKSGGLDLIERLLATDIKEVKSDSRLKLNAIPDLSYWGITINVGKTDRAKNPLGQNPKVRQALELAIDRDAINQVVFNGEFVPGNQWIGPDNSYYQKSVPISKRDIAKAKALIKEAGVTTPIAIDFMVPQGAENKAISEVVQAMAAEAGFDMKIRVTEFATSLKAAEVGEYQAYLIGWSGRTDPDGNLYTFHACNAPNNNGGYCNQEVDKLMNEARTYSDPAKRKPVYEKVAKALLTEGQGHIIYLYHRKVLIAQSTRLDGFVPVPDGLVRVVGLRFK